MKLYAMTGAVFGFFIFQLSAGWFFLGRTSINFGDLEYVVQCAKSDGLASNFFSKNGCTSYMYGSLVLRIIEIFGVSKQIVYPAGILMIACVSFILSYLSISNNNGIKSLVVGFVIIFSPPVELILQRGNLDSLIFTLVFISSILILKNRFFLALMLLCICSLVKFYTIPTLIVLSIFYAVKRNSKMKSQIYLLPILLICAIDVWNVSYFPSGAQNFFGAPIFGEYLMFLISGPNSHASIFLGQSIGICLFIFACMVFVKLSAFKNIYPTLGKGDFNRNSIILFSINFLVFFSCYFAGLNIDYRLIFIAAATLAFLTIKPKLENLYVYPIALTISIILYTSYNTYVLQPIGDFFILIITAYFTVFFKKEKNAILNSMFPYK
jgi:hypothetical protein